MYDVSGQDRAALVAMLDQALRDGERTEPPATGEEGDRLYGSPETLEPDEDGWITRVRTAFLSGAYIMLDR